MSSSTITTRLLLFVPKILHDPKCPNYPKPLGLWPYGLPKAMQDVVRQQYCCNMNHKNSRSNSIRNRNSDNNTAAAVLIIIVVVIVIIIIEVDTVVMTVVQMP